MKKSIFTRLMSFALALLLAFSTIPLPASAEEESSLYPSELTAYSFSMDSQERVVLQITVKKGSDEYGFEVASVVELYDGSTCIYTKSLSKLAPAGTNISMTVNSADLTNGTGFELGKSYTVKITSSTELETKAVSETLSCRIAIDEIVLTNFPVPKYGDAVMASDYNDKAFRGPAGAKYYIPFDCFNVKKLIDGEWKYVSRTYGDDAEYYLTTYTEGEYQKIWKVEIFEKDQPGYYFTKDLSSVSVNGEPGFKEGNTYIAGLNTWVWVGYRFTVEKAALPLVFEDDDAYDYRDLIAGKPIAEKQLLALGGTEHYTFTKVSEVCDWLTVSPDGIISGTPTAIDTQSHLVEIRCSDGEEEKTIKIQVYPVKRDPAAKIIVDTVELNQISFPKYGDAVDRYAYTRGITYPEGAKYRVSSDGASIKKKINGSWEFITHDEYPNYQPTYTEGEYRVSFQVRIEGSDAADYCLANPLTSVKINGQAAIQDGHTAVSTDYSYARVYLDFEIERTTLPLIFEDNASYDYDRLVVGKPIEPKQLVADEGTGSYTFSKVDTACSWLTVSPDGVISGTPTAADAGTHDITVKCSDGNEEKTISVRIGVVHVAPANRTKVAAVELNQVTLPTFGDAMKVQEYTKLITYPEGAKYKVAPAMTTVYKNIDGTWRRVDEGSYALTEYTAGDYRVEIQVRIDGDTGLDYCFADTIHSVQVNGADGYAAAPVITEEYSYVNVGYAFSLLNEDLFTYEEKADGTVVITGFKGKVSAVEIPAEIDGKRVTEIGENAFKGTSVATVVIPEGVTALGKGSFADCTNLTAVSVPATVTTVGQGAFSGSNGITDVYYGGAENEWQAMDTGSGNEPLMNAALHIGHVHAGTLVSSVAATCTAEGVKAYYSCTCGKYYQDSACTEEIKDLAAWKTGAGMLAKLSHVFTNKGDAVEGVAEKCILCGVKNINYAGLDSAVVSGDKNYTGSALTSDVTITGLTKGVDYTVENVTGTDLGSYAVVIKGIGAYAGERTVYWKILYANGLWFAEIPDQTYTGKAIKPELKVFCDGVLLTAGKDYTVTYKNNTKVASKDAVKNGKSVAPSVTVTGKGNYYDQKTMTFSIVPCPVTEAEVNDILVAKSSRPIKVNPAVKLGGKTLKQGTDFVVSTTTDESGAITSLEAAGQYELYVVGKNSYTGCVPFRMTITEKLLASKVTVAKIADQKYDNGNEIRPAVTVTYNKKDVTEAFDITYQNNREIGTAAVTVTAKAGSDFAGSKTAAFKITGINLRGAVLGADGKGTIPAHIFDGKPYQPALDLYVGAEKLTVGTDYTVTYAKNVNVGTATATVVGKGNYTGSKSFTFKISKYDAGADAAGQIKINGVDASAAEISIRYEKGGAQPKPVVKLGSTVLEEKTDYTLSYTNNKAVAAKDAVDSAGKDIAPTMTITFKGNLSGKKTIKFTIVTKNIAEGTMTLADKVYSAKDNAWKQTAISIVDTNGKKLTAGTDYSKTFTYYSDPGCTSKITAAVLSSGTRVYVKVEGINNYAGSSIVKSYRIAKSDLAKAGASIAAQTYTGEPICPTAEDIQVWVGKGTNKTALTPGVDYVIVSGSYTNNVNKGTATVTIIGRGDYYGTKVVKFTIGAKRFLWWEF